MLAILRVRRSHLQLGSSLDLVLFPRVFQEGSELGGRQERGCELAEDAGAVVRAEHGQRRRVEQAVSVPVGAEWNQRVREWGQESLRECEQR